ncbi:7764_t:CDS:2 [Entrophospora sp. SA101]|nr:7764_t:CDS:2 [Entrophospora sp. SA101]
MYLYRHLRSNYLGPQRINKTFIEFYNKYAQTTDTPLGKNQVSRTLNSLGLKFVMKEWGNYDLKFIVKGKEQLQNKTTLSQMQSSWPTQTVTASTTSDTVPPAKKWRLASPKNYDPNKRIIVGFSDAMFNVWMKRKTGRCM